MNDIVNELGTGMATRVPRLALAITCALTAGYQSSGQSALAPMIDTFPSPYMNAKDTPLVELDNGAMVGQDSARRVD